MDTNKTEKMFDLVDQWKASGKTQKAFCHDHDIKIGTFGYWVGKKKRSEEPAASGFALDDLTGEPSGRWPWAEKTTCLCHRHPSGAGSPKAAQRAAMIYSFFSICKSQKINPYQWLTYLLENIMSTKYNNIRELYPQNFKSNM